MSDVFRVIDRFNITGRGTIYILKKRKEDDFGFRLGDILCDLRGDRFEIAGIEMFRYTPGHESLLDTQIGVLLNPLDNCQVCGSLLVKQSVQLHMLFCSQPFEPEQIDSDFEGEYTAAKALFPCTLVSYEDLLEDKLVLKGLKFKGLVIYRGWMMPPDIYARFYDLLDRKGMVLINTPEEYTRYHQLPGWYEMFNSETAQSVWTDNGSLDEAVQAGQTLEGPCIVKDYVKSRKHEWYDACFIRDIQNENEARRVIGNFLQRQGEDLAGGVVIRQYVPLKQIGYHEASGMPISEEYRVFVFAGHILTIDGYWKQDIPELSDAETQWIASIAAKVQSSFVTVDLARKEDGTLTIMEFGDGQVSGLQNLQPETFYAAISKFGTGSPASVRSDEA